MGACKSCMAKDEGAGKSVRISSEKDEIIPRLPDKTNFELKLHSASLSRSFAKIGWMDPYAILTIDGNEVGRTPPSKWAHMEPKWNSSYAWSTEGVPDAIRMAVWDKNTFHKDVLCGAVTIPCDPDMGHLEDVEFTISKRNKPTGVIRLSLSVKSEGGRKSVLDRKPTSIGMEFDTMAAWAAGDGSAPGRRTLRAATMSLQDAVDGHDEGADSEVDDVASPSKEEAPATAPVQDAGACKAPALLGSWKCVDTFGLDEFLKATGVGMFQRKIAKAAKWPAWEYHAEGDGLLFLNHSAIGDLREVISLTQEYDFKDGHGNMMKCKAAWETAPDGGVLTVTRAGAIGSYKEERRVAKNTLDFTLTHGTGVVWGRKFERL